MSTSTFPYYSTVAQRTVSDVLAWEHESGFSRDSVTILAGDGATRTLVVGTVLGRRLYGIPVAAAAVGNTGNGTLSALALTGAVMVGLYQVIAQSDTVFGVIDPDGRRMADAVVGTPYDAGGLTFELAAAATPFEAGDAFTVTVPVGDGKMIMIDPAGTDGTQIAAGVLMELATAPAGLDVQSSAVVRDAYIKPRNLVWPDGMDDAAKAAALAALAGHRIFTRQAV